MMSEKMKKVCRVFQRITVLIGVLTIVLPVLFWSRIPEEIPSHYNAFGEADQYSGKGILIFILFVVAILMGIMGIATYCICGNVFGPFTD